MAICLKRDHMMPSNTDFIEVRWTLLSKINSCFEIEPFYRKRTLLSKMSRFIENEPLLSKIYLFIENQPFFENEPFCRECIGSMWIVVTPSTDLITSAMVFGCPEGCFYALYNFEPSYSGRVLFSVVQPKEITLLTLYILEGRFVLI